MRSNASEPFQHLETFQGDAALRCVRTRKDRAPNGMRVQDRAGIHATRDGEMEQGFRGRTAFAANDVRRVVDLQKLRWRKGTLVQARRSNGQPQWVAGNHGAKVSTRAQNPATFVKALSNFRQLSGNLLEDRIVRLCSWQVLSAPNGS